MVRFGIIGYGKQGSLYANILTGTPLWGGSAIPMPKDCILTAVSARNPAIKEEIEALPNVRYFKDWQDLVASDCCDAVIITVPHFSHHEIAIAALDAGKHVLCEKPMTIRADDAQAICDAQKRHPACKAAIMFNQRANPLLQNIKYIIDSGTLGTMRNSYYLTNNWWRPDNYYTANTWRGTWSGEGGGILVNQACHPLDLWIWLCGMPQAVYARCMEGAHRNISVENDVMVMARYEDGRQGFFSTCSHDLLGTDRLEITFDQGKIILEGGSKATILQYSQTEQDFGEQYDFRSFSNVLSHSPDQIYHKEEFTAQTQFALDYLKMFENFADCILRNASPIAPLDAGLAQVQLANAIQLSGWTNEEVALPCCCDRYNQYLTEKMQTE